MSARWDGAWLDCKQRTKLVLMGLSRDTLAWTQQASAGEQGSYFRYTAAFGTTLTSTQVTPSEQSTEAPYKARFLGATW